jgi:hypothetical protein
MSEPISAANLRARIFGENDSQLVVAVQAYSDLSGCLVGILSQLETQISVISAEKNSAVERLSAAAGADVEGLATVEKRLARKTKFETLAAQQEKIRKEREFLTAELRKRSTLVREYELLQQNRTNKRTEMKDSINTRLATAIKRGAAIAINFYPRGNREEFQKKLGIYGQGPTRETGILKGIGLKYLDCRFAEIICATNSPSQVVTKILEGRVNGFAASHTDGKDSISEDESKRIVDYLNPRIVEFGEEYFVVDKLEQVLSIDEIELNDLPQITLEGQSIA